MSFHAKNRMENTSNYRIDPELRGFLPKLSAKEYHELKASIKAEKRCLSPVIVWEGVLVDGHHRSQAVDELRAEGCDIAEPAIIEKSFADKLAVIQWMTSHQDARRNWTAADKAATFLKNKDLIERLKSEAKANQRNGKGSARAPKADTRKTLAELAGVGEHTIDVVQNVLDSGDEKLIRGLLEDHTVSLREAARKLGDSGKRKKATEDAEKAGKNPLPPLPLELAGTVDRFILADVLDGLTQVKDDSVSLVVTSPPYPLHSIAYENYKYKGDYQKYLDGLRAVFAAIYPKLRVGGRVAVNLDSVNDKGDDIYHSLIADFTRLMVEAGYLPFGEICWYKQNSIGARPNWGTHPSASNSDELRPGCRRPRIRRQHEYVMLFCKESPTLEGELSDITPEEFELFTMSHWYVRPEPRKAINDPDYHPAPFPEEIPYRLIKLLSYVGDTILDPYSGSGTTCYVAKCLNRHWIGIDNAPGYIASSERRLAKVKDMEPAERIQQITRFMVPPGERTDGYARKSEESEAA